MNCKTLLRFKMLSFLLAGCSAGWDAPVDVVQTAESESHESLAGDTYTFSIVADPQLATKEDYSGDWAEHPDITYRKYYQTIQAINRRNAAFVVVNGDLVATPHEPAQYRNFVRLTRLFTAPVALVLGNHDGHTPFTEFYNAQRQLSGYQNLYYSFDVGQWHYVSIPVFPTSGGIDIPTFLQWLDADLAANAARPTMVFTHYHFLPQGLTQLEYYAQNPVSFRNLILDTVLKYGNVKFWFAGHVHNGIQASVKLQWEYRGCRFITVPTTVRPRNFGEEYPAFERGIQEGGYYLNIDVQGTTATVNGKRAGQPDTLRYPDVGTSFDPSMEPRWFARIPDFEPQPFTNGTFEGGLAGWNKVWRYRTDGAPGFFVGPSELRRSEGARSVKVTVRAKPGDWNFDEMMEIYQVVGVTPGTAPQLALAYNIASLPQVGGGFLRVHGFKNNTLVSTHLFYFGHDGNDPQMAHTGKIFCMTGDGDCTSLTGFREQIRQRKVMFWRIPSDQDQWHRMQVNLKDLHQRALGSAYDVDKVFIGVGVWVGKTEGAETQTFFDNVRFSQVTGATPSQVDGVPLRVDAGVFTPRFLSDLPFNP